MFSEKPFEEKALPGGVVLLEIDGKLRGWRARSLAERLGGLARDGAPRVVLNMTELRSMDSLGRTALVEALDLGLRINVIVRRRDEFEDLDGLAHSGLRFFGSIEAAFRGAASRSGRAAVAV
jgi:hypothetical protein